MLERSNRPARPRLFFLSLLCGDKLGEEEDMEGREKEGMARDFFAVIIQHYEWNGGKSYNCILRTCILLAVLQFLAQVGRLAFVRKGKPEHAFL